MTARPEPLTHAALAARPGIRHGFFTRAGGVSGGLYAALNCGLGSGDRPERVHDNRARAMAALGLEEPALATVYQVHSAAVATVDGRWPEDDRPQADGLVTRRRGVALGILTADCAPVLLADAEAGVIGAAHAGWRGALAGVLEATVGAMVAAGARRARIAAAVGPCIGPDSYEVGPEFPDAFGAREPADRAYFRPAPRDGHWLFDLPGYAVGRLTAAGVEATEWTGHDTLADAAAFFSYRRAIHRGEPSYGRLLSAIALAG